MPAELPLSARVADGAFRGFSIGVLWVGWFLPSEMRSMSAERRLLQMGRFTLLTPLGFASFFAAYNAVLCGAEKTFGRGMLSPALAGGTAGAFVGSLVLPLRAVNVAGCAASTAMVCMFFQRLLNGPER